MAFGPPPGPFGPPPGPFGPGGTGFPPPNPFGPTAGAGGGIVVHRARLLPRLALVAVLMAVSFGVTGAVIWFAFVGATDDVRRSDGEQAAGVDAADPGAVAVPAGWPDTLGPPEGATLVSSVTTGAGTADQQLILVYELTQDARAAGDVLRYQLAAAGFTLGTDAVAADGTGSLIATGGGREATVSVVPDATRPGVTTISWVLRAGPR